MKPNDSDKPSEYLGSQVHKGRGATLNPTDRFAHRTTETLNDEEALAPSPLTEVREETVKSALSKNDSPDVSFTYSINPYRGCEHGCVYCYARPSHEYLGMSLGLDFETKLIAKVNVAEVLRQELSRPKWEPQTIALSGNTDCYQPIERERKLTRACLEVFAEFRNPVSLITKSSLVRRDIDLLGRLNEFQAVRVHVSVTTLNPELALKLEPRASAPAQRLRLIRDLRAAGIPVGVMVAPLIPGLTDEEIPAILEAVKEAGSQSASFVMLRLPYRVSDLFEEWLKAHYPERAERVLGLIRQMRGGSLKETRFGYRMRGEGVLAQQLEQLFTIQARRWGLDRRMPELSSAHFQRPAPLEKQLSLF